MVGDTGEYAPVIIQVTTPTLKQKMKIFSWACLQLLPRLEWVRLNPPVLLWELLRTIFLKRIKTSLSGEYWMLTQQLGLKSSLLTHK